MSKVISFSISDRYLDKLRTLYPALTDNLAVKQFVTDGLDGSLGNSLDDGLDGKLKTLIESELDGLLEGRLDAFVGKSLTSLSDRLSRLEERLDDSLDGRLDDMERLLKLQREASITSLIPTIEETSPLPTVEENVEATIDTVETVTDNVEAVTDTVETAIDTVEAVDTVESDSIDEPVTGAIGPVHGDSPQLKNQLVTAVDIGNRQGLTNAQLSKKIGIPTSTIEKWKGKIREGKEITSSKYPDFFKQWRLNPTDNLWHKVD